MRLCWGNIYKIPLWQKRLKGNKNIWNITNTLSFGIFPVVFNMQHTIADKGRKIEKCAYSCLRDNKVVEPFLMIQHILKLIKLQALELRMNDGLCNSCPPSICGRNVQLHTLTRIIVVITSITNTKNEARRVNLNWTDNNCFQKMKIRLIFCEKHVQR